MPHVAVAEWFAWIKAFGGGRYNSLDTNLTFGPVVEPVDI